MNKKRQKDINALASRLPVSYEIVKFGKYVNFSELLIARNKGLDVPQSLIDSAIARGGSNTTELFHMQAEKLKLINHKRKIRRAFSRNGIQGAREYLIWLKANNQRVDKYLKSIDSDKKVGKWSSLLDDMINSDDKSFWGVLAAFIMSFLQVFGINKEK